MQEIAGDNDDRQSLFWKFGLDPQPGAARDNIASLFEMAMLLQIFGKMGEDGEITLSVDAFESLYVRHEIPEGFTGPAGATKLTDLFKTASKMWWIQAQSFAKRGLGDAVGKKPAKDADYFEHMSGSKCPFLSAAAHEQTP